MWTMGYSDGGEFNMASDSFSGRKLMPLIPRTPGLPNSTYNSSNVNTSPPRLNRLHGTDFFSINHHLATMADQGKKDFHAQPVVVSSRWNPTPEQLRTLEELYRRGTRTPSAEQIQHITAQLRRYGKIEGKNVFYWFQNHKARERQKRRRQMESTVISDHEQQQQIERKESEAHRTAYEGEQTKNWVPTTNCSILPEESISIQRAAVAAKAAVNTECRTAGDGWIQFDEVEFQHRRNFIERNATWQMMQLSCPSPIINPTSTITKPNCSTTLNALRTTTKPYSIITEPPKFIKTTHDLNIFIAPAAYNYRENGQNELIYNTINEDNNGKSQTLQLFPLRSDNGGGKDSINGNEQTGTTTVAATAAPMNANFTTPHQFFEFLPLKN